MNEFYYKSDKASKKVPNNPVECLLGMLKVCIFGGWDG